ncbi:IclR family transcriptional regulator [Pseudonocardia sp. MH-G8]|nr:IclR family transcriptional regulator [Pseudonocardia sp. MH-G8]
MSKTLHLGLRVLELLAERPDGLSVTEVAAGIDVHRTVAHRLLRTLEAHHLCRRDKLKRFLPGSGLVTLAAPVERDLRALAAPVLEELADAVGATAHLVVQETDTHVRSLLVVQPQNAAVHVTFRTGQLDSIDQGSAGLAMLAALPHRTGERPEVGLARERGFAHSFGEVIPAVHGISAVVPGRRAGSLASIGVSVFQVTDETALGSAVRGAAQQLGALLRES